ncbi:ATP-binding protein [Thalassobius sp. Cn5-15]|uniref:ATP-binding protein n=1 Tax=Thalassobius sp. Cn5-15 TaxID=2917763 RepID=UPI001EF25F29|nr:ATP-binding protein [Thalassobius sp. Cn5-15]MCG7492564.1 ATP-binding protein [Thalassobius sp. Cn5-15]
MKPFSAPDLSAPNAAGASHGFEPVDTQTDASDAGVSVGAKLDRKLRSSVTKLCFAALLATAAVFQLYMLVQSVANGTQQIANASRGAGVFATISHQGDGLLDLITTRAPRDAQQALAQRQMILDGTRDTVADLSAHLPTGGQLAVLQRAADQLLAEASLTARTVQGPGETGLVALQQQAADFAALQVSMNTQAQGLAQQHLEALAMDTRQRVLLMVLALAGTVFMLSSVLVSGLREMARRQEIERELHAAMAEVDQVNKAKTRFLSTVTHEIRTPLNAILGFSELLGREPLSADQKQQVSRLNSAGRTLSRIVDDVLDLSRIEEGGLDLRAEAFSPNELFRETIDLVSVHSQAKGLVLTSEVSAKMPRALVGDSLRLSQVLLNLLNNAIKFTAEGSVTLRADVRLYDEHARLRIEVQDSGIGIAPEDQARLFDRYAQAADGLEAQNNGGTGLGLAISQGLVQEMGGQLQVHSTPGQGATFWFYLDLPVADARTELPVAVPELSVLNAAAERMMLVDDSADTGELVQRIMGREGIHVELVTNPLNALAQVMQYHPDVILCDMQMPELSGVELTRKIRALPAPFCDVPVIAFSATSMTSEIEQMLAAGANAFIAKPFQITDLVAAISGVLTAAGVQHGERAAARRTGHSFAEVEQMVEMMGKAWVQKFLGRLSDRLNAMLQDGQSRSDRMAMAHRVVAEAGQIGEKDLALAATSLEQALRDGADTSIHEAHFANEARAFLSRLPLFNLRFG